MKIQVRKSLREVPSESPYEVPSSSEFRPFERCSLREVPSESPFGFVAPAPASSTRATAPRAAVRGGRPRSLCASALARPTGAPKANPRKKTTQTSPASGFRVVCHPRSHGTDLVWHPSRVRRLARRSGTQNGDVRDKRTAYDAPHERVQRVHVASECTRRLKAILGP